MNVTLQCRVVLGPPVARDWARHVIVSPRTGERSFTAHILAELAKSTSVEQMILWTLEPKKLPTMTFGKPRGVKWSDIPIDYLQWMSRQADMDTDASWCASQELARRSQSQPYSRQASTTAASARKEWVESNITPHNQRWI